MLTAQPSRGPGVLRALIRLDAGAFASVMATGIVSVAARLQGPAVVSDVLLALAVAHSGRSPLSPGLFCLCAARD